MRVVITILLPGVGEREVASVRARSPSSRRVIGREWICCLVGRTTEAIASPAGFGQTYAHLLGASIRRSALWRSGPVACLPVTLSRFHRGSGTSRRAVRLALAFRPSREWRYLCAFAALRW